MIYVIVKKYRRDENGLRLPPDRCDESRSGPFTDKTRAEQFAVNVAREDSEVLGVEIRVVEPQ